MRSVLQQQTLAKPASFSGIGLHSGNKVEMTLLPAPPNSGITFRRVDLDSRAEIPAQVGNVAETDRSTTISKGNTKVQTVEHVLAALYGFGITNAVVELNASEPPVADGSARQFCKMIHASGIEAQAERVEPITVTEPIEYTHNGTVISAFPHDGFKVTCTSSDKGGRFTQFFSVELTPESWESEIAQARTFCFYEEIEYLIKNGLIRGGSLENAIVIRDDAVLTTEPMRYREEFVRHKILDIIGDLSLVGSPVHGHIVAVKPGHAANCGLARRILQQAQRPRVAAQSFSPPDEKPAKQPIQPEPSQVSEETTAPLDAEQIMQILPHRYPFLMVDRVTRIDGNQITAEKNVTINEPYFQGHFPGHPIMPGVLQLEAMAQVAGILTLKQADNAGKIAYFMSAEKVKWRKPVKPGDVLQIDIELLRARGKVAKARGVCTVRGDVVSEAEITFSLAGK
ncbi:MAG: bifunctional UDP-3-O-[3-hydroxymyristoyl] N-acetylglucosamine deacetylase/3-hydroxyacyl-ACP dehydratase [Verrucomicrobiota bacterium]|jgi:UDP-3-O-[3-hydroxymyristoyl] N-acetylglucosamine deacetylase/3-hydroxyacyl-[acyl-carrier-protein] dehydratase|nr:bifunctional UDP-3-O-[3-hydroxymyristoyl] N-acetylglucosamine deacetylase/3-hydroxyacyl-ACP dehydratase [Verrucomicrobiota bacterium]MDP6752722.1 bifunctional UDP-3-O-[3-hydroxymyristoyl] N-acetylglucosamine deacetylase/3-hydroxyacyl-ACP dehydratase [Verrucomicrobiota bacterium]MDP7013316.1 bifunctional UDP-3-O-[3-hydroxymyristoyl] N-acetylglucosamine deacetylase/3-hydroxyacyl-ACP dehydratase [Verrucomicrobiota bacterium]